MFDLQGLTPQLDGLLKQEALSLESIMRAAKIFNKFNGDV
jgi:hypothetical protein